MLITTLALSLLCTAAVSALFWIFYSLKAKLQSQINRLELGAASTTQIERLINRVGEHDDLFLHLGSELILPTETDYYAADKFGAAIPKTLNERVKALEDAAVPKRRKR